MKGTLIFLLLWATVAHAQPPTITTTPAKIIWNDETEPAEKPTSYIVTVEMVVPAPAIGSPCTNCVVLPVLLTAPGTYSVQVQGRNAKGITSVASWTEVRDAGTGTTPTTDTSIPPAVSLTDETGGTWTRTASTSRIYRNGAWVATGSEVLWLPAKQRMYYHHVNGQWYEWHAPYWWTWGPTKPQ